MAGFFNSPEWAAMSDDQRRAYVDQKRAARDAEPPRETADERLQSWMTRNNIAPEETQKYTDARDTLSAYNDATYGYSEPGYDGMARIGSSSDVGDSGIKSSIPLSYIKQATDHFATTGENLGDYVAPPPQQAPVDTKLNAFMASDLGKAAFAKAQQPAIDPRAGLAKPPPDFGGKYMHDPNAGPKAMPYLHGSASRQPERGGGGLSAVGGSVDRAPIRAPLINTDGQRSFDYDDYAPSGQRIVGQRPHGAPPGGGLGNVGHRGFNNDDMRGSYRPPPASPSSTQQPPPTFQPSPAPPMAQPQAPAPAPQPRQPAPPLGGGMQAPSAPAAPDPFDAAKRKLPGSGSGPGQGPAWKSKPAWRQ